MKKLFNEFLALAALTAFALSACGPSEPTPTPVDVNAVYTMAAQTFAAEQTSTALANPTATFTPSPTNTAIALPTASTAIATVTAPGAAPVIPSCDNSAYVKDVTVPDGTVMTPGQTFTKTWLVTNTGTCAWTATYKLAYGYGEAMGGAATAIGKTVDPGAQAEVSVNLTAPTGKTGDLTGVWRLSNDKGEFFGTYLSVLIKVGAGTTGTVTVATTAVTVQPTATTGTPATP